MGNWRVERKLKQMLILVVNWCRRIFSELQECPWWRIACLVTTVVCLLMVRYITGEDFLTRSFATSCCVLVSFFCWSCGWFLQTGSGKTYTMMGEIKETQGCLDEDSGITPRVFDYLFMRIKEVWYLEQCFHVNSMFISILFYLMRFLSHCYCYFYLLCRKKKIWKIVDWNTLANVPFWRYTMSK